MLEAEERVWKQNLYMPGSVALNSNLSPDVPFSELMTELVGDVT